MIILLEYSVLFYYFLGIESLNLIIKRIPLDKNPQSKVLFTGLSSI